MHPYLYLINAPWHVFLGVVLVAFLIVNFIFAFIYFLLPPGAGIGIDSPVALDRLLNDFFFSSHTLTTVGYGNLAPAGVLANSIAAFEALVGLMGFALATGLAVRARLQAVGQNRDLGGSALVTPYQGSRPGSSASS